jgi:Na+-transporting methylmalonyl-CoA/oxaloacetate decarboxylase gamma subunit
MNLSKRNLLIIGAAVFVLLSVLIFVPVFQSALYQRKIAPHFASLESKEKVAVINNVELYENSVRLTVAQIIGGIVLLAGLYFTYRNLRVTEEGKITDRFSNAVEMLGSENLDVRIGGIYALERVARDSQKDHWTVMEILTAYLRKNHPYNPRSTTAKKKPRATLKEKASEDVQAIMTVIGRRKWTETEIYRLDLRDVDLTHCIVSNANLRKARLNRSNLRSSRLFDADFSGADLWAADFSSAYLTGKDPGTNFSNATLNAAKFKWARLDNADFTSARNLELEQITSAFSYTKVKLGEGLARELEEWKASQAEKDADAGENSKPKRQSAKTKTKEKLPR